MKTKPLKVFHRRSQKSQVRVTLEPEPTIVIWIAQDDASLCSPILETLKPRLDESPANSTALLTAHNGDGAKTEPGGRIVTYRDRRKRDVADNFTFLLGDKGYRQGIARAQPLNDRCFCAARVGGLRKGVCYDRSDCCDIPRQFIADYHAATIVHGHRLVDDDDFSSGSKARA